eukprot:c5260_g1_i1 orf=308-523(+)
MKSPTTAFIAIMCTHSWISDVPREDAAVAATIASTTACFPPLTASSNGVRSYRCVLAYLDCQHAGLPPIAL